MTLLIKNGEYAFLIRLDLMLSMSLWKEFQLLQILNDLSIKHLVKLIFYENVKKMLWKKLFIVDHLVLRLVFMYFISVGLMTCLIYVLYLIARIS